MQNGSKNEGEIKSLLASTEDGLYSLLADEILPPSMNLFSEKEKLAKAREWFNAKRELLQERVCGSAALHQSLHDGTQYETVTTVATVIDLITGLVGGVPLNVVAVLIVKQGYNAFCKDYQR